MLVLETTAPGGQAGSSSRIENYLGFPTGISGQDLAGRALMQAEKFGAEVAIGRTAVGLDCDSRPYRSTWRRRGRADARPSSSPPAPSTGSPPSRSSRASRARASSTAPPTSRRSSARARRSPSWAAATPPARRRSFSRRARRARARAGARPGPRREHVALPHPAHRETARTWCCARARRSRRWRETAGLERVRWRHLDTGDARRARSVTCS